MRDIRRPLLFALPLALVAGTLTGISVASTPHAVPVVIKTLSVRADLVSGGKELVQDVGSQKAGRSRHQDAHGSTRIFRAVDCQLLTDVVRK